MSVDYRAIYGYGYHINADMCAEMDEEKFEEFIDHDLTHIINSWGENSDYFFGIVVCSADDYAPIEVIPFTEYEHGDFIRMVNTFHHFFPEVVMAPKHYVIQQVS